MRRILFVYPNLNNGTGPTVALIGLLNALPPSPDQYEYYLLLISRYDDNFSHFWHRIPPWVQVLPPLYQLSKYSASLMSELRNNGLGYMADIREKVHWRNAHEGEDRLRNWTDLQKIVPDIEGFDVAVAYTEDIALQIVADKVIAPQKIGWVHTDYKASWDTETIRRKYALWRKLHSIVCVSNQNRRMFIDCYPDLKDRTTVMYNPHDGHYIRRQAEAFYPAEYRDAKNAVKVFTSGTIGLRKGTDLVIQAMRILLSEGYCIKWFIAGNIGVGPSHDGAACVQQIADWGLNEDIILLGYKENPYPYFKHCDLYVHPSRYEGLSVAIQEAKILCKPILVTCHSSVDEIISDGTTGIICDINADSIAKSVKKLITDTAFMQMLSSNLEKCNEFTNETDKNLTQILK